VGLVISNDHRGRQDGRRYLRSETMAVIDAVIEHEGVSPAPMIAS
jgi:hypothetical protein